MKIFVTGHQGRIGSHLVSLLVGEGHLVRGYDLKSGEDILAERWINLYEYAPGVIIHLAAQSSVQDSLDDPIHDASTNILGTLAVLEQAREIGCRAILAASAGTTYDIRSPYGLSKRVSEEYAAMYSVLWGVDVVTLGLGNVYGPRMGGVVGKFIEDQGKGITINGDGTQTRDFIYVGDVVRAFAGALTWDSGYYEVATGVLTSVIEVYKMLVSEWKYTPKIEYTYALPGEVVGSPQLRCDLPWQPLSLKDGLSRMVKDGSP